MTNIVTERIERALRILFLDYEESLAKSGILLELLPNYVGVQLDPEVYFEGLEAHLKCNLRIEVMNPISLDEDTEEEISSLVMDWLRAKQVDLELHKVGVDPEIFDWVSVSVLRV